MPSTRKSTRRSGGKRKLNSYQKAIHAHKKSIAAMAEKKGIRFMAAAAMMLKKKSRSRKSKKARKSKSKSRSRKSKSRSRKSKSRSRKSKSRKSKKSKSRKSKKSHNCSARKHWRKGYKSVSGKRVAGKCVKNARKSKSRSRK